MAATRGISFVEKGVGTSGANLTSGSWSKPNPALVGDLVILVWYSRESGRTFTPPTTGSSANQIDTVLVSTSSAGFGHLWVGARTVIAGDSSWSWSATSSSNNTDGYYLIVFRDAQSTTGGISPVDRSSGANATSFSNTQSPNPPAITAATGLDQGLAITIFGKNNDAAGSVTPPSGYTGPTYGAPNDTQGFDATSGTDGSSGLAFKINIAAGVTEDPAAWTLGGASTDDGLQWTAVIRSNVRDTFTMDAVIKTTVTKQRANFSIQSTGGAISSSNTTYATARTGSNLDSAIDVVGQTLSGSSYSLYQYFMGFATSTIPAGSTVESATLKLNAIGGATTYTVQARVKDWGSTVGTEDWVAGGSLSSQTLVATQSTSAFAGTSTPVMTDVAVAANVVTGGTTRFMLVSANITNNVAPTADEVNNLNSPVGTLAGTYNSGAPTVDAVLKSTISGSFTADAVIKTTRPGETHYSPVGVITTTFGATLQHQLAQSFLPGVSGSLSTVLWYVIQTGSPADNLILELQSDNSNKPSGTVLATLATITGSTLPTAPTKTPQTLNTNAQVTSGTRYWLVARRSGSIDDTNAYQWWFDASGADYPNGSNSSYNGTTWSTHASNDFAFFAFISSPQLTADAVIVAGATTVNGSFTANAVIKREQTGSFTGNAVVKREQTGTLTADAVIKREQTGSLTANAVIFRTITGTATADAVLSKTQAGSFTADALKSILVSGSFTANAVIKATIAGSVTADAVVFRTQTGSATANAVALRAQASTFTVDATVRREQAGSLTGSAVIFATISASFTGNAVIKREQTGSFTANAVVRRTSGDWQADLDGKGAPSELISSLGFGTNARERLAQSFTPAISGLLSEVAYVITRSGTPADNLIVEIQSNTSNRPNGVVVGSVETVAGSSLELVSNEPAAYRVIPVSMPVQAGTKYWIVARRDTIDDTNRYSWQTSNDSAYAGGGRSTFASGAWSAQVTTDQIFSAYIPLSFTANAVIRSAISSSFTGNAFIHATLTANAVIRKTQTGSASADAFVHASFRADAVIRREQAGSFTAHAFVEGVTTGAFSVDAVVKATVAGSLTADAAVLRTGSGSFTCDAVILRAQAGSITADAFLAAGTQSGSFDADAVVRREQTGSLTADAVIRRTSEGSLAGDAVVFKTIAGSFTTDAVARATRSGSFTCDATILRASSGSETADAVLLRTQTGSATAEATLRATQSGSLSASAFIHGRFTANAVVLATVSSSFKADAFVHAQLRGDATIRRTQTGTLTADAFIAGVGTFAFSADAVIRTTQTGAVTSDAVALRTSSASFGADAVLTSTQAGTLSANATIRATLAGSVTADAVVTRAQSGSFTGSAVARRAQAGSLTADAYVQAVSAFSFTANAVALRTASATLAANAVIRVAQSSFFTGDAHKRKIEQASVTADAVVLATRTAGASANAVFLSPQTGSLTAAAVARRTQTGTLAADAVLIPEAYGFTADAVIFSPFGGTITAGAMIRRIRPRHFTATLEGPATFGASLELGSFSASLESTFFSATLSWPVTARTGALTAEARIE